MKRHLPEWIIGEQYRSVTVDCEELRIQHKFSNPHAKFSDDSQQGADIVAFHFMVPEAAAYWLPQYLDFIENRASSDSNHFPHIESILTSTEFAQNLIPLLSKKERARIGAFINWWKVKFSPPTDKKVHGTALITMQKLWKYE